MVIGTSCAGKSTLARSLCRLLSVPHIELDALYWGPNWTSTPLDRFRDGVAAAVSRPAWVADGNYESVRDLVWGRATRIVWLNYPLPIVFARSLSRTARRFFRRETLYSGNRERLALADPDWIPWWVLRTHHGRTRMYRQVFAGPEYAHLPVRILTHPSQVGDLLAEYERFRGAEDSFSD